MLTNGKGKRKEPRARRRGGKVLPAGEKRAHCVSVRLNDAELALLDSRRRAYQRGEWLRIAALDRLPPSVPAVNVDAWSQLARVAGNLNQLAAAVNAGKVTGVDARVLDRLRERVDALRDDLVGVRDTDEHGDAE